MANFKNISLRLFRKWLDSQGCKPIRIKGGHEMWCRNDLNRSIPLQTHIDPVPPRIINQFLSYLKVDRKTFLKEVDQL